MAAKIEKRSFLLALDHKLPPHSPTTALPGGQPALLRLVYVNVLVPFVRNGGLQEAAVPDEGQEGGSRTKTLVQEEVVPPGIMLVENVTNISSTALCRCICC